MTAALRGWTSRGDREIDELPRRVLAEIPDTYLVADAPGRCLLVKPVIGANSGTSTCGSAVWQARCGTT